MESTLRLTVTSAYFVVGRSSLFRRARGLLRFGAVTVVAVALYDLVCLRFVAVTMMLLLDLALAADRRSARRRSVLHSIVGIAGIARDVC